MTRTRNVSLRLSLQHTFLRSIIQKIRSKKRSRRAAATQPHVSLTAESIPDFPADHSSLSSHERLASSNLPSSESQPINLPSEASPSSSFPLSQIANGVDESSASPFPHIRKSTAHQDPTKQLKILTSSTTEFFVWYSDLPSLLYDAQTKENFYSEFQKRTERTSGNLELPGDFMRTLVGSLYFQVQRANAELMDGKTLRHKAPRKSKSDAHAEDMAIEKSAEHSVKTTQAFLMQGLFALTLLDRILAALSGDNQLPALAVKPRLPPELHQTYRVLQNIYENKPTGNTASRFARLHADRKHWRRITTEWELPRHTQPSTPVYNVNSIVECLVHDLRNGISSMTAYSNVACAALSLNFWTSHQDSTTDDWKSVSFHFLSYLPGVIFYCFLRI